MYTEFENLFVLQKYSQICLPYFKKTHNLSIQAMFFDQAKVMINR